MKMRALLGALLFALPLAFGSAGCASGEPEPAGGEGESVGDVSLAVTQCGLPIQGCEPHYKCVCAPPYGPDAICNWRVDCSTNPPRRCGGNSCN